LELVFWEDWVLDCETADKTCALLQEIVRAVPYGKQVSIPWVPLDRRDMFLSRFFGRKSPKWEHGPKVTALTIHGIVLVVLVILKLLVISVLNNHSLHDLEASLHTCGVKRVLDMLLLNLLRLLVLLIFHCLFELLSLDILIRLHV